MERTHGGETVCLDGLVWDRSRGKKDEELSVEASCHNCMYGVDCAVKGGRRSEWIRMPALVITYADICNDVNADRFRKYRPRLLC